MVDSDESFKQVWDVKKYDAMACVIALSDNCSPPRLLMTLLVGFPTSSLAVASGRASATRTRS